MLSAEEAVSTLGSESVGRDVSSSPRSPLCAAPASARPRVSVIIPAYNAEITLAECLACVYRSTYDASEVVLVDDGSTDHTREIAAKMSVRVVSTNGRAGPAAARNLGASLAEGEILFFVDTDVMLRPDSLDRLVRRFAQGDVDAVCGVQSVRMRHRDLISQYKNLWMRWTYIQRTDEVPLFYTTAAAIRRTSFWQAGGFDLGYTSPSLEDTAFGQKLARLGIRVRVQPDLEVEHVKRYSLPSLLRTDFRRAVALSRLKLRHRAELGQNNTSVPTSYIASIPLALLGTAALLVGIALRMPILLSLGLLSAAIVILLNREFLHTIRINEGWGKALASVALVWMELVVAGVGACSGLVSFPFGSRY
jgi:cellulose synthase/poly-beta-1,6-N-acetylglucosamine synthase-like glycosyltransferase